MITVSKRMKEVAKIFDQSKDYRLEEAVDQLGKFPAVKFDETVELHLHLNIDTKKTDQAIRGTVILPHGTGRKIKIAVFCKGEKEQVARDLGADHVGAEDLIEKVAQGFLDFDCVVATPDMMRDLSKLGKVLGPRGLMPSPKTGTVTADIERAIKDLKAGKVEFKSDKQAGIHVGIGKRSFGKDKLMENAQCLINAVTHLKPTGIKGAFFKSLVLSTTMGPGVKVTI